MEVVLYSYSIGMVYIFIGILLSGTILPPFYYCLQVCLGGGREKGEREGEGERER